MANRQSERPVNNHSNVKSRRRDSQVLNMIRRNPDFADEALFDRQRSDVLDWS